ncbi:hypothetical protein GCM10020295_27990 [Streptomyces cinereospinus]
MRPLLPPPPERSAALRRRFAAEARAERPDLATLCLLVGAQADGTLDEAGADAAQAELDRLAGLLPFRPGGARAWAVALRELLGERCGFHGSAADYQRLESSLLHTVVRRRRGLPILLSVVWIEVARRAGGRRCTAWRCRGTSWSASASRPGGHGGPGARGPLRRGGGC